MTWSREIALSWMRKTARDLGKDGLEDDAECLRASSGALYYAWDMRLACDTREEFVSYLQSDVGWHLETAEDVANTLERRARVRLKNQARIVPETRFDRITDVG